MTTLHWLGPGSDLMISPRSMDRLFERFVGYGTTTQEDGAPTYALRLTSWRQRMPTFCTPPSRTFRRTVSR